MPATKKSQKCQVPFGFQFSSLPFGISKMFWSLSMFTADIFMGRTHGPTDPELKKKERVSGKRRNMAEIGKNERS